MGRLGVFVGLVFFGILLGRLVFRVNVVVCWSCFFGSVGIRFCCLGIGVGAEIWGMDAGLTFLMLKI